MLLNSQWVIEEVKEVIKKKTLGDKWKQKQNDPKKSIRCNKSSSKREVAVIPVYLRKQEKSLTF